MHIVGIGATAEDAGEDAAVHTIDAWYSDSRRVWVVERLDAMGRHVGVPYSTASRVDASACLVEWLRAHPETHLASPIPEEPAARPARRLVARRASSASTRDLRSDRSSGAARTRSFGT